MKIPVAIYARVSSERQAKGDSNDHQISMLKDYIATRLGDNYYTDDSLIYRDDAISGYFTTLAERPAMKQLIDDARKGKFKVALFKEISRMGRDGEENVKLPRIFESVNVRVIVTHDFYDSDRPESKSFLPLSGAMAERYSEGLSLSVSSSLREKARSGKWSGPIPIGYKLNQKENKLEIDENTAHIPKLIFDLYANKNYGVVRISKYLNERGYTTSRGLLFDSCGVRRILANQTYIGKVIWGKTRAKVERIYDENNNLTAKKRVMVKRNDSIAIEGVHTPIIDEKTFWRVQEIRSQKSTNPNRKTKAKHPLVGVLFCLKCGTSMICQVRNVSGHTYRYYKCAKNHRYGKLGCDQGNIRADKLEKIIYDQILAKLSNVDFDSYMVQGKVESDSMQERLKRIKVEKQKLIQSQTKTAIERYLFTDESYRDTMIQLRKQIEQCDQQLHIIEQQLFETQNRGTNMTYFAEVLKKMSNMDLNDIEELRSVFQSLIERIEIVDTETIGKISYRYTFG